MTGYTDDDVTADHGPLCGYGVRCPDCGWPVPPKHDAAIAARALRQAAADLEGKLAVPGYPQDPYEFRAWLRARARQVNP